MQRTDRGSRGPIWAEFTRAQNGLLIDNLSRAFHLPRPKAKAAILDMLAALTALFDEQTLSRSALARLIELLGKNQYELVLEDATLMGATSTQVIGSEALTALAGHNQSTHIAGRASAASGVSQMISDYLLPVVAAIFMGALFERMRPALLALARNDTSFVDSDADGEAHPTLAQLPVGRGSSGVFSGSTVISSVSAQEREALFRELGERIRAAGGEARDPLNAARQIVAEGLGVRARNAPWLARAQKSAVSALQTAHGQIREQLRKLRSR